MFPHVYLMTANPGSALSPFVTHSFTRLLWTWHLLLMIFCPHHIAKSPVALGRLATLNVDHSGRWTCPIARAIMVTHHQVVGYPLPV